MKGLIRLIEIVLSAFGIVVTFPILALSALLIRCQSSGEIIFRQVRIGQAMRPFTLYKLRTMVRDASQVTRVTAHKDARVTPLGRVLRALKIDELPQLWNVFRGDMALVGARPEVREFVDLYPTAFQSILASKPGLVDPAALLYVNEEKRLAGAACHQDTYINEILPHKLKISQAYLDRRTPLRDLGLLLQAGPRILAGATGLDALWSRAAQERRYVLGFSNWDLLKLGLDLGVISLACALSAVCLLRLDRTMLPLLLANAILFQGTALLLSGVATQVWRHFSFQDAERLILASGVGVLLGAMTPIARMGVQSGTLFVLIQGLLVVAGLGAMRCLWRALHERTTSREVKPVLVAGSSRQVELFIHQTSHNPDLGIKSVAALCPHEIPGLRGFVHNIPVYSRFEELTRNGILDNVKEIHVVGDPGGMIFGGDLTLEAKHRNLPLRIVPPVWASRDWRGKPSMGEGTDGLLSRKPFAPDQRKLASQLAGKTVVVTGAGGSIGSQIVRSLAQLGVARIVGLDIAENTLCYLSEELHSLFPDKSVRMEVGSVLNRNLLNTLFSQEKPEFVFHAAAHKHVNFMEGAADEALSVNVEGTHRVAEAAARAGVETFVLISTDKAASPTSVMGATKRLAESVVHALSFQSSTRFCVVRFGNVLGSEGSLLPILRRQISRGGPLTISHPDATRFFISVREAAELVLFAGALSRGRETFILEMGEPVRIMDLARDMAALYGEDLEELGVTVTGLKPGEKIEEELWNREEKPRPSPVPGILVSSGDATGPKVSLTALEGLYVAASRGDAAGSLKGLVEHVPEYAPSMESLRLAAERSREVEIQTEDGVKEQMA